MGKNGGRRLTCAHKIDSEPSGDGVGLVNIIIFLAVQTQALLFHDQLPVGWGGVGRVITFLFLCTHRHSNLIIFLAVQQTQALLIHDQLPVWWGGVGQGNNVHVPVHTQAQQPYHLSCCPDTGTAHS